MKRSISVILSFVFLLSNILFISFAHSGRTDASGGHRDNKNKSGLGSYHYHCGGNPAHLHKNGICPYIASTVSKNKTSTNNTSNKPSVKSNTSQSNNNSTTSANHIIVTEEIAFVREKASIKSEKLAVVKEGHEFVHIGSTKSFWKIKFKKKDDDTVYIGYILKTDVKEK